MRLFTCLSLPESSLDSDNQFKNLSFRTLSQSCGLSLVYFCARPSVVRPASFLSLRGKTLLDLQISLQNSSFSFYVSIKLGFGLFDLPCANRPYTHLLNTRYTLISQILPRKKLASDHLGPDDLCRLRDWQAFSWLNESPLLLHRKSEFARSYR